MHIRDWLLSSRRWEWTATNLHVRIYIIIYMIIYVYMIGYVDIYWLELHSLIPYEAPASSKNGISYPKPWEIWGHLHDDTVHYDMHHSSTTYNIYIYKYMYIKFNEPTQKITEIIIVMGCSLDQRWQIGGTVIISKNVRSYFSWQLWKHEACVSFQANFSYMEWQTWHHVNGGHGAFWYCIPTQRCSSAVKAFSMKPSVGPLHPIDWEAEALWTRIHSSSNFGTVCVELLGIFIEICLNILECAVLIWNFACVNVELSILPQRLRTRLKTGGDSTPWKHDKCPSSGLAVRSNHSALIMAPSPFHGPWKKWKQSIRTWRTSRFKHFELWVSHPLSSPRLQAAALGHLGKSKCKNHHLQMQLGQLMSTLEGTKRFCTKTHTKPYQNPTNISSTKIWVFKAVWVQPKPLNTAGGIPDLLKASSPQNPPTSGPASHPITMLFVLLMWT